MAMTKLPQSGKKASPPAAQNVPANPGEQEQPQPGLSAAAYAWISLAGLLISIGLLVFFVYVAPKLIESGVKDQVFYLVLIPWGLSSAAFLFGAMRAYARLSGKHLGIAVELGGPVVIFCLVVYLGSHLIPQLINVTVRPFCKDVSCLPITKGTITLEYGTATPLHQDLDSDGRANFLGVSDTVIGNTVWVSAAIYGYDGERRLVKFKRDEILDLPLQRARMHLLGTVSPRPVDPTKVRFFADDLLTNAQWDESGFDLFPVFGRVGDKDHPADKVRLRVCVPSSNPHHPNQEYDEYVPLGQRAEVYLQDDKHKRCS